VLIPRDEHIRFLTDALADAGVAENTTALFLVAGTPQAEEAEVVYIPPPNVWRINYPLLGRIGSERLHEYDQLHRFAAYQEVDDAPLGAIATELRHETQHAVQFNLYGPDFVELNQLLRDLVRATHGAQYEEIPSERDANRTAAKYAADHHADDLEAMAGDVRFHQYTSDPEAVGDLLAETVEMVWQLADREQTDEHTQRPLGEVVDELRRDAEDWHRQVENGADFSVTRQGEQQAVVEVPIE
jgi:hypothetical protein